MIENFIVESTVKVRYAETDQMGVVYYGNYFIWMEIGRTDYCRVRGFSYADMEKQSKAFLVVADAHCRYISPAYYDNEILISTQIKELRARVIKFSYLIKRATDKILLAEGETLHVVTNENGKPIRCPEKYFSLLKG